jgi:hypothetical protein
LWHSLSCGVASVEVDGQSQQSDDIVLSDDRRTLEVRVVIGEKVAIEKPEFLEPEAVQPKEAS